MSKREEPEFLQSPHTAAMRLFEIKQKFPGLFLWFLDELRIIKKAEELVRRAGHKE